MTAAAAAHNSDMLELGLKTLIAYLLGTLLGGLILGRFRGVDIRNLGSGNAGATNALRTQGRAFGLAVLSLDVAKGVVAVLWLPTLVIPGVGLDAGVSRHWLALACGFAVIVGHVYPVWFGFRGGKGVATVVGVVGALAPLLLVPLLSSWLLVVLLTGFVGLASMLAGVALVVAVYCFDAADTPLLAFCILITVFVIFTHRGNIARMAAGTESRAQRLWLFRSRAA
jgi:glycerol-3-phosphate acyltransferase PlsY